jgi:hypothetical protein
MREYRSYGSVRGALSNERPYRENGLKAIPMPQGRSPLAVGKRMGPLRLSSEGGILGSPTPRKKG